MILFHSIKPRKQIFKWTTKEIDSISVFLINLNWYLTLRVVFRLNIPNPEEFNKIWICSLYLIDQTSNKWFIHSYLSYNYSIVRSLNNNDCYLRAKFISLMLHLNSNSDRKLNRPLANNYIHWTASKCLVALELLNRWLNSLQSKAKHGNSCQ